MRYFTRGWANGEFDEDASTDYRARLQAISAQLPESARRLSGLSLHDGIVESMSWSPSTEELTITLATGTSESGYFTVSLTYLGAQLGEQRVNTLRSVARDRETEVLYDEVDLDATGTLIHRLLFWPRDEVTIDFRELRLEVAARADRRVHLGGSFVELDSQPSAVR